ncbi:sperm-specific sodium:proton exchanger-like [Haemaphysalis longicornis]
MDPDGPPLSPTLPDYELRWLIISAILIAGSVSRMVAVAWRVPKIVVSAACGLLVGALAGPDRGGADLDSVRAYASMYVPAVTYTVTIRTPYHVFCSCALTCLTLGTAGFVLSGVLAVFAVNGFQPDATWRENVHLGLMIAYQEPTVLSDVITPSPFKTRVLETVLAGEALVSTSLFFFWEMVDNAWDDATAARLVTWFACFAVGSLVLGKAVGHAMAYVLDHLHYEATLVCSLSMASVYLTYYVADLFLCRGGMLGVIAMGLTMKACATSSALSDDEEPFLRFWSAYRYVLAVVLVFMASLRIGRDLVHVRSWRFTFMPCLFCIFLIGNRVITVVVLFPVLRCTGYQLSAREVLVLAWIRLKGPVALVAGSRIAGVHPYVLIAAGRLVRVLTVLETNLVVAFTLTPLMKVLGMLRLDASESKRVRVSIRSVWEAAAQSRQRQRAQRTFSGADWKWIEGQIYLPDLLSLGYQLESPKDEGASRMAHSWMDAPKAFREVNRNIRTIQTVSLRKQFESGMIHPETHAKILTALEMAAKDDGYLHLHTMKALLHLPKWLLELKDKVLSALPEGSETSSSASASDWDSELLSPSAVASNRQRRQQQCVLYNSLAAISLATALAGVLAAAFLHAAPIFTTAAVTLQGCIVLLHSVELVAMYARGPSASFMLATCARLDLAAYLVQLAVFSLVSWRSVRDEPLSQSVWLVALFIALAAFRAHKFCTLRKVVHEALLRRVDGVINWRVFRTYDMAVAFVKTEQELAQSTALAMAQHRASAFVRDQVAGNNIELQKELIGIQQRYPQLECVARSRLIARRILNSSLSALNDLHESGLVEQHHYAELGTLLEQKIRDLNRLPGSVSVPETTISFLLSVPWLPAHSVPKIRKRYCWKYTKGQQLVTSGKPHQAIHIVFSGIVLIEAGERGEESGVEKRDVLANSDSLQYYGGDEPFRDYMVGPGSLGIIGFLNRSPSVCDVTCETDIEACILPISLMDSLVARDTSTPCILYRMWFWVAVRIAQNLMHSREEFDSMDPESLRRYVEQGRLPYLGRTQRLVLHEDVDCAVLIQGEMTVTGSDQQVLFGPEFVPGSSRSLDFPGELGSRPLPVLLLLCKPRYRLPNELDWQSMPAEMFSGKGAAARYHTRTISAVRTRPQKGGSGNQRR